MRPLPYDYTRCMPQHPGEQCNNCRRWWDHPQQTYDPYGQSRVFVTRPGDRACIYIPDSFLEEDHD